MLDPGELILNRAQQKNISAQLTAEKSSQRVLHISISGNSFYGDDASFIDKIGDAIIEKITQNLSLQSF